MCVVYHMAHYMWCIIESSPTYPPPSRRCQSRSQSLTFPWLPQLNYHSRSTTIFHYHTYVFLFFFLFSLFYSSPVRFPFPFSHEGEPPIHPPNLFLSTPTHPLSVFQSFSILPEITTASHPSLLATVTYPSSNSDLLNCVLSVVKDGSLLVTAVSAQLTMIGCNWVR